MDKYVKPQRKIPSYRTKYGEITPKHLENGMYYFKSTSLNFVFKQPCLAIVTSIIFYHNSSFIYHSYLKLIEDFKSKIN